nr:uncharacterized protein LOC113711181 [Coffea arabica]
MSNRIGLIQKRDGDWCKDVEETGVEIIQYFKDIFTFEEPQGIDDILNDIPQSITNVKNKQLTSPVTEQEVHRPVFSMHPSKSPGPNGKQILDNVLVAHECNHFLNNKRSGKKGYVAIKLDIFKAYDRIEWTFLEKLILKIGFCQQWVGWIMECVSSVSYSVNSNREKKGFIKPIRGLRQGDLLSPFLFLICAEGFSALFNQAVRQGKLTDLQISYGGPRLSHLFFCR